MSPSWLGGPQKQLGKDAELAACEIVRRAERGLGVAIRRGQEEGTVLKHGQNYGPRSDYTRARGSESQHVRIPARDLPPHECKVSPATLFTGNKERVDTYAVTDNVSDEQFEDALDDAKAEENLSRAGA